MKKLDRKNNPSGRWSIVHKCGHEGRYIGLLSGAKAHAERECLDCRMKRFYTFAKELGLPELKGNVEEVEDAEYVRYMQLEYDCVKEAAIKFMKGSTEEKEELWQKAVAFDAKENEPALFYAVALCVETSAGWWLENWR